MYRTHSVNDYSCVSCGQSVWFNVAYPTGKWSDPSPRWSAELKIRAEKMERARTHFLAQPDVHDAQVTPDKCQLKVTVPAKEVGEIYKSLYPTGFAGVIPLVFIVPVPSIE